MTFSSRRILLPFFPAALACAAPLLAQPVPLDPHEIQLNSYTTGDQWPSSVAALPDGRYVTVWLSEGSAGTDSSGESVQARLIDAHGTPLGPSEFQVNTYTTGNQEWPSVAADSEGNFVVVWNSDGSLGGDDDRTSVQARRFRSDGTPLDPVEFQVNSYTTSYQGGQDVAVLPGGGFVVVWSSYGSWGSDTSYSSIQARRFGADGVPLDPAEFQVNVHTLYFQRDARVATDSNGGFVVVWQSDGSLGNDQSGTSIQARRFAANGTPLGPVEFQVNTYTPFGQHSPVAAMTPDGKFVIAWTSDVTNGGDTHIGVQARRFAANGTPLDPEEFQANAFTNTAQLVSGVTVNAEGDFAVAWSTAASAGGDQDGSAQARRFHADGTPVDPLEFQLNSYTTSWQFGPVLAGAPDGDFIAVWPSYGSFGNDSNAASVQLRRFGRPTVEVTSTSGGTGGPDCTLRDAITAANTGTASGGCPAGNEGAVVELPEHSEITLTQADNSSNGLPVVLRPLTILGHGSRIERDPGLSCPAGPEFRPFEVADGGILELEDVSVANGCLPLAAGGGLFSSGGTLILRKASIEGNESGLDGGGVAVSGGNLLVYDSTVRGNLAGGTGGGVALSGEPDWVRLERTTVSGNSASEGGGLALLGGVSATVVNSTIVDNAAALDGGGVEVGPETAGLTMQFATVAGNAAPDGAQAHAAKGRLVLHDSLVGESANGPDCAVADGALTASGANLDTDGSCAALAGGSITTVPSLELGPLVWNGGPTWTRLPLPGSPALDAAPACVFASGATLWSDQRGHYRPTDDDGDLDPRVRAWRRRARLPLRRRLRVRRHRPLVAHRPVGRYLAEPHPLRDSPGCDHLPSLFLTCGPASGRRRGRGLGSGRRRGGGRAGAPRARTGCGRGRIRAARAARAGSG